MLVSTPESEERERLMTLLRNTRDEGGDCSTRVNTRVEQSRNRMISSDFPQRTLWNSAFEN